MRKRVTAAAPAASATPTRHQRPNVRRAAEVRVEMGEYLFRLDRAVVRAPHGRVVLRPRNAGRMPREAILLRLPEDATGTDLFNGQLSQRDVTTIAQENGAQENGAQENGAQENGAHGMTAPFTVVR
ncbi:hypothetical protein [Actinomadura kijaniata]|uniref:hypothetical protein n=1 Tax=Actinomadura kijaniata TaxID=46161 RepID=UPI00082FDF66|nr:hypothetical protein [Actinomadura kijaniata]